MCDAGGGGGGGGRSHILSRPRGQDFESWSQPKEIKLVDATSAGNRPLFSWSISCPFCQTDNLTESTFYSIVGHYIMKNFPG